MAAFLLLLLAPGREIRVQASEGQTFRALLVTRGDYQGTSIDLTPGPENDGENVKRMLEKAYGEENITVTVRDTDRLLRFHLGGYQLFLLFRTRPGERVIFGAGYGTHTGGTV